MIVIVKYCTAHTAHELADQGWAVAHLFGRLWRAVITHELPWPTRPLPLRPPTRFGA